MSAQPKVLVLGGMGFIARHLLKKLCDDNSCSKIRLVDKAIPETANWSPEFMAYLSRPNVERIQASLVSPAGIQKAFAGDHFDFVIHLAAETRFGQAEAVYKQHVLDLAVACGQAALEHHCTRFIYVSTAQVYDESRNPCAEGAKTKPWTLLAKYSLQAEQALRGLSGLPLIILRPAIVYGTGDMSGLTPRLICGAVYKRLNEKMEFLWTGDLRLNTVHVRDVASALWHCCQRGAVGETYNLADKNDTNQEKINQMIELFFRIETGFAGSMMSNLARANFKNVVASINEKHTQPWTDLCREAGIEHTPLTPFLDQELLYNNPLAVDGSKIEATGFRYEVPMMTPDRVKEVVDGYILQGLFPCPAGWPLPAGAVLPTRPTA